LTPQLLLLLLLVLQPLLLMPLVLWQPKTWIKLELRSAMLELRDAALKSGAEV
jgi:hypothetical protein